MSVSSEAPHEAQAGRGHAGGRDGREHRFLTRTMRRVTGTLLGRGRRPPRRSGHRSARGPARAFQLVTPTGPSSARSPANSEKRERDSRNDQWDTFTERRKVSPGLRSVSECLACIASGVPGTRRALPSACPQRSDPGADSSGRLALIACVEMTYLGGARSRSVPCHRSGFRPRRAVREEKGRLAGSRRRAGVGSFGVARWLRRDHPGPIRGGSSRGVVLVPLGGHQIGQAQRAEPQPERLPRDPQEPGGL
jgi:hypothetical protein